MSDPLQVTSFQPRGAVTTLTSPNTPGITQLPLEILLEIFCLAIKTWSQKSALSNILQLCAICRYWRQICFETPALWSQIDIYDVEMAELSLQRCTTGPLDICARSCRVFSMSAVQFESELNRLMLPHRHRIRSVEVSSDHLEQAVPILLSFLAAPVPLLRSIKLHRPYWPGREQPKPGSWTPVVGTNVRSLDLSYVHLPLDSHAYRNMVQLSLRSIMQDPHRLDDDVFARILQTSPGLKILELEFSGPALPRPASVEEVCGPTKVVQLRELERVAITDTPANLAYTISHFSIPGAAHTSLEIVVDDVLGTLSTVFSPGSSLISYTDATNAARITSCAGGILIQLDGLDLSLRNASFRVTRNIPRPDETYLDALLIFLGLFPDPHPSLQITLSIPEKCFYNKEWTRIIRHPSFANMKNLKIEGNPHHLFDALRFAWPAVHLPSVKKISLQGHFVPSWGIEHLEQYLLQREGPKIPQVVMLRDDFGDKGIIGRLQNLVDDLVIVEPIEDNDLY